MTATPFDRVPRDVLVRALRKARLLYVDMSTAQGHDPGPAYECWAEFEALAEYVGRPEDDITFDPTMPWTD
jgi:hypothetical protein